LNNYLVLILKCQRSSPHRLEAQRRGSCSSRSSKAAVRTMLAVLLGTPADDICIPCKIVGVHPIVAYF
jgi:hypothetical protein